MTKYLIIFIIITIPLHLLGQNKIYIISNICKVVDLIGVGRLQAPKSPSYKTKRDVRKKGRQGGAPGSSQPGEQKNPRQRQK